jgi:hypothetical protein
LFILLIKIKEGKNQTRREEKKREEKKNMRKISFLENNAI